MSQFQWIVQHNQTSDFVSFAQLIQYPLVLVATHLNMQSTERKNPEPPGLEPRSPDAKTSMLPT